MLYMSVVFHKSGVESLAHREIDPRETCHTFQCVSTRDWVLYVTDLQLGGNMHVNVT